MPKPDPLKEGSSSKGKGKAAEIETFMDEDATLSPNPSSSEDEKRPGPDSDPCARKMKELEQRLDAIANRSELHEEGLIRPYPAEWDIAPYLSKFKAPTLHAFNGTGSPNQHMY